MTLQVIAGFLSAQVSHTEVSLRCDRSSRTDFPRSISQDREVVYVKRFLNETETNTKLLEKTS